MSPPHCGIQLLTVEPPAWLSLALSVWGLTLAVIVRIVDGKLGALAVPVWLVTLPSALYSHQLLSYRLAAGPSGLCPWLLIVAPFVAFYACTDPYRRSRTGLESFLVGIMFAGLGVTMWVAILDAVSI